MAAVAVAAARGCRCGHVVLGIVVGIGVVVVLVGSAASAVGVVRGYSRISPSYVRWKLWPLSSLYSLR